MKAPGSFVSAFLDRPLWVACPLLAVLLMGGALAQDLGFSNAGLNGTYAWVRLEAGAEGPDPDYANWTLVNYNGDGTWDVFTSGSNYPGEPDAEGNPTRQATLTRAAPDDEPLAAGTYELSADGTYMAWFSDGTLGFHGVVLKSEMVDGVPLVLEVIVFQTSPDNNSGGLHAGRKWLMNPR